MILGILAVVICVFLCLKIVSRRLKWHRIDGALRKMHKPGGILVIAIIAIHILITLDVWSTRNILIMGSGMVATLVIILMAVGYCFREKLGSRWIVLHRRGAVLLTLLILCHIAIYYVDFFSYKSNIASIEITGMDASEVKDGTYQGEYNAGYIYAKVELTVSQGKISEIHILKHDNERGTPAEVIIDRMVEVQNTKVDTVSGATNSSLVIEKAVENALEKGRE